MDCTGKWLCWHYFGLISYLSQEISRYIINSFYKSVYNDYTQKLLDKKDTIMLICVASNLELHWCHSSHSFLETTTDERTCSNFRTSMVRSIGVPIQLLGHYGIFHSVTHGTPKYLDKLCRPRSDATECSIWSGIHCYPLIQQFLDTLTGSQNELVQILGRVCYSLACVVKISADDVLKYFSYFSQKIN